MRTWEPLPQVSQPSLSLLSICFFLARETDPKIPDPSSLGLWPQFIDLSLCCLSVLLGTRPKSPSYPPFLPESRDRLSLLAGLEGVELGLGWLMCN